MKKGEGIHNKTRAKGNIEQIQKIQTNLHNEIKKTDGDWEKLLLVESKTISH